LCSVEGRIIDYYWIRNSVKENGLALIFSTVSAFRAYTEETRENYVSITDFAWRTAPIDVQWEVYQDVLC